MAHARSGSWGFVQPTVGERVTSRSISLRIITAIVACAVLVGAGEAAGGSGVRRLDAGKSHVAHESHVVVQFFGDSLALTLAIALADPTLESKYDYKSWDGGILGCGVAVGSPIQVSGQVDVPAAACRQTTPIPGATFSALPWPTQWQHWLSLHHPNVAVLLAGRWEITNRVYDGQWTNILNPVYANYIKGQLELASNLVTASGANMVFLTSPCVQTTLAPNGTPFPEEDPARLNAYNQLVRQVAAEHPKTDSVVDLDSVVCPGGIYSAQYKGVTVRQPDGVHFEIGAGAVLEQPIMKKILASGRAQKARLAKHKAAK
jgi:hypothetical protein